MDRELKIRRFLKERFGNYDERLGLNDSLVDIIDSLGLFELVTYLEEEFSVYIPTEDFSPSLFITIKSISNVIEKFPAKN